MAAHPGPERKELKAQWKTEVEVPIMSLDDVAPHSTKSDLWIVIHDKVYDVTKYARDHPGGADLLVEVGGKDATSDYEAVGHSEDAREIMHPFLVGTLPHKTQAATPQQAAQVIRRGAPKQEQPEPQKGKSWIVTHLLSPEIEIGALALSGLGLGWLLLNHISLPPKIIPGQESHSTNFFSHGFALASAISGTVAAAGLRYASKSMDMGPNYTSYAAHIPISTAVPLEHRPRGVLTKSDYTKFPLIRKDELSRDIFRLVFALPESTSVLGLPTGQHVAIRGYWDDDEGHRTVTRSYTPVSNNKDLGRLELLIRCYPDGQLTGKYLSKLQVGDAVEFRGPTGAMQYRRGLAKQLGMVAGGTGITPMYQLIRAICEDQFDDTEISLIYANRSESDILMRTQLDHFASTGQLKVFYMLDKPSQGWKGGRGYVNKQTMQEHLPACSDDTMMLLCGPPPMVNGAKKGLVELGFRAPGAVSKTGDQVFCF